MIKSMMAYKVFSFLDQSEEEVGLTIVNKNLSRNFVFKNETFHDFISRLKKSSDKDLESIFLK